MVFSLKSFERTQTPLDYNPPTPAPYCNVRRTGSHPSTAVRSGRVTARRPAVFPCPETTREGGRDLPSAFEALKINAKHYCENPPCACAGWHIIEPPAKGVAEVVPTPPYPVKIAALSR